MPTDSLASYTSVPYLAHLSLDYFRSYTHVRLQFDSRPVVVYGENGAGKTNLLEAISLLIPGRGLRGAPLPQMMKYGAKEPWLIFARLHNVQEEVRLGTALKWGHEDSLTRIFHLNGEEATASRITGDIVHGVWLAPHMDAIFSQGASVRRQFLDHLAVAFQGTHMKTYHAYETLMRERGRLLAQGVMKGSWLDALECRMAEHTVILAATRLDMRRQMHALFEQDIPTLPFARPFLSLQGTAEDSLRERSALDTEDKLKDLLQQARFRDKEAGRAFDGGHRCAFMLYDSHRHVPACLCSVGEQKIMLISFILAYAQCLKERSSCFLLLLDDVLAHLDSSRRSEVFRCILALRGQTFVSGTDLEFFRELGENAQYVSVSASRAALCLPP